MYDISIIIPVYNEELVISGAIEKIGGYFSALDARFELVVVDDGSTDDTVEIVKKKANQFPAVRLIENKINYGKGFSVRRGVLESRGDWMLFLDADLSTQPEEFEKFRPFMNDCDIIIGSRTLSESRIILRQPLWRVFGGKFFNLLTCLYLGLPFRDTQCGFKCFHNKTKSLFEKQTIFGWVFDVEILYLAQKAGFRIKEVPVIWKHHQRSRVKARHIVKTLADLIKIKN